jgi:hypothetical protein
VVLQALATLPSLHRSVVLWLLDLMNEVVQFERDNKMTAKSMGASRPRTCRGSCWRRSPLAVLVLPQQSSWRPTCFMSRARTLRPSSRRTGKLPRSCSCCCMLGLHKPHPGDTLE